MKHSLVLITCNLKPEHLKEIVITKRGINVIEKTNELHNIDKLSSIQVIPLGKQTEREDKKKQKPSD